MTDVWSGLAEFERICECERICTVHGASHDLDLLGWADSLPSARRIGGAA